MAKQKPRRATDADASDGNFQHAAHGALEHDEVSGKEDGVNREEQEPGEFKHSAHGTADPEDDY